MPDGYFFQRDKSEWIVLFPAGTWKVEVEPAEYWTDNTVVINTEQL